MTTESPDRTASSGMCTPHPPDAEMMFAPSTRAGASSSLDSSGVLPFQAATSSSVHPPAQMYGFW